MARWKLFEGGRRKVMTKKEVDVEIEALLQVLQKVSFEQTMRRINKPKERRGTRQGEIMARLRGCGFDYKAPRSLALTITTERCCLIFKRSVLNGVQFSPV